MQFVFPALAWGFLLILVPVVVHLINLMRHRRQRWAAMEFLLESYRKHKRWVWLKQALLLLSRMAVMALLVAMLAQWISGSSWMNLFGETVTHHYVVLDDSYSMSDTIQGSSAYQKGLSAIGSILRAASAQGGSHQVTLIRCSRAIAWSGKTEADARADVAADLLARSLPPNPLLLLDRLTASEPTPLDVGYEPALKLIAPLIESASNQRPIVYLVSDFRRKDWNQPEGVRSVLEQMSVRSTKIELVDCVETQHQNLTVDRVEPEEEILAAGIPLMVRIQIRNHGSTIARNVQVRVKTTEYRDKNLTPRSDQASSGVESEMQPILIDQIAPGEVVSRRIQVLFAQAGWHSVEARLPDDAVDIDNRSHCVVRIEEGQKVLLVDGDPSKRNAFFLDAIMNPGSNAKTGIVTQREGPEFLRDVSLRDLSNFSSILLLDIPRLDRRGLNNLKEYAELGGGIAIFFGNGVDAGSIDHYNTDWYADGQGILPCKLVGLSTLLANKEEGEADMMPLPHPIFSSLMGLRNSPFQFLRISRFVDAQTNSIKGGALENGEPIDGKENRALRVFAKLRNGAAWAFDTPFRQGRVVVFLTGLSQDWTNWAQDPTFVVATLKMVGYLGSFRRQESSQRLTQPLTFSYPSREVLPSFSAIFPASKTMASRIAIEFNPEQDAEGFYKGDIATSLEEVSEDVRNAMITPGIVELWTTRVQGDRQVKSYANTVSPAEGDLSKVTSSELQDALRPVEVRYRQADSVANSGASASHSTRNTLLMIGLLALLILEQFLAWSTSYHLPRVARGGAV